MHRPAFTALFCALFPAAAAATPGFAVEKLADGIYAAVRTDPPGLMVDANCLFLIGPEDVIVVDAPEASQELIVTLKKLTHKPVHWLVNTHWHDDHIAGDALWREAWPEVRIVGHELLHDYLPNTGAINRRHMIDGAPKAATRMQQALDAGVDLAGTPLDAEQRASYASDIALVANYMVAVPRAPILLPDVDVETGLVLHQGQRRIEIRHLGRGHTAADLVVWLPRERIVASGDLVVWPVPLVGGEQSHIGDWPATLEKLIALSPVTVVPGHGPVLRDLAYPRALVTLFESINAQVRAAGEATLDAVRAKVDLALFRQRFAGESKVRRASFDTYVTGPAIESAWRDLSGAK